jgi:CheY-like chemotaxis protein
MKKIVIVEADPDTRFLYRHTLCKEFDIEFVQNGEELLARLPDTDMIIINTRLIDTSFYKLCREFRSDLKLHVPILAIATSADLEALQDNYPADALLSRPFTNGQLCDAVYKLIENRC